jgi:hypothetical protein
VLLTAPPIASTPCLSDSATAPGEPKVSLPHRIDAPPAGNSGKTGTRARPLDSFSGQQLTPKWSGKRAFATLTGFPDRFHLDPRSAIREKDLHARVGRRRAMKENPLSLQVRKTGLRHGDGFS